MTNREALNELTDHQFVYFIQHRIKEYIHQYCQKFTLGIENVLDDDVAMENWMGQKFCPFDEIWHVE